MTRSSSCLSLPLTATSVQGHAPAVSPPLLLGGRLQLYAHRWKKLFPDSSIPVQLEKGIRWEFISPPPLSDSPIYFPCSPTALESVRTAALDLLHKGAVERLPDHPSTPGFYSRLFTVPKPSGEARPIIDLSALNKFVACSHFRMETPATIRESIQPGEWTFQVDLKDAYLHIPVHPAYRKYLRFSVGKDIFQFRTLPFGLSVAPRIFTYVLKPVVALLREKGIKVHAYLDDWLGRSLAQTLATAHGREVTELLTYLGWVVNWEKSDLSGTQTPVFIGLQFLLVQGRIRPGPEARESVRTAINNLKKKSCVTARQFSSVVGKLKHWAQYIPRGRLQLRHIQHWLKTRWTQTTGRWNSLIQLDDRIRHFLRWWTCQSLIWTKGVPLHQSPPVQDLYTDASTAGWGASLDHLSASGHWDRQQRLNHINVLEMRAVFLACKHFEPHLKERVTRVHIDNMTVVAHIRKEGGTRSWQLTKLTQELLSWCDKRSIQLLPVHISGLRNVMADSLSRTGQIQASEWSVSHREFTRVCSLWGTPSVDLMATVTNRVVPEFISPVAHPAALGADVFRTPWPPRDLLYVFPPTSIVPKILNLIRQRDPHRIIVIAPMSSTKVYHPDLLEMALAPPVPICRQVGTLQQTLPTEDTPRIHRAPELFQLAAWLVAGPSHHQTD